MAAAADSKSAVRKYVRVRVPPLAPFRQMTNDWRGVRVVDGATLERLCGGNSTGGSNPPLSAKLKAANLQFSYHPQTKFASVTKSSRSLQARRTHESERRSSEPLA